MLRVLVPFILVLTFAPHLFSKSKWKMGVYENITIVSNDSDGRTEEVFREVQLFRAGMKLTFGNAIRDMKWPLHIVICKDNKTFSELIPKQMQQSRSVPGYYQRGKNYDLILLKSDASFSQMKSIVFHEMGHRVIETMGRIPLWLDEGYAQVFQEFSVKGKVLKFGLANDSLCMYLSENHAMDLKRVFNTHHTSDEYSKRRLAHSFYATSWAFVHMCMFANEKRFKEPFLNFTDDLKTQAVSEELFRKHFGMSYDEMEQKILRYVRGGKYYYNRFTLDETLDIPEIHLTPLSEVRQRLYQAHVLIHSKRYSQARNYLVSTEYMMAPLDESADEVTRKQHGEILSAFSNLEYLDQNFDLALEYGLQAYECGNRDPLTLELYCRSLLGMNPGYNTRGEVDSASIKKVFKALNILFSYSLRNHAAHQLHAEIWSRVGTAPRESHQRALFSACVLYPRDQPLHYKVADIFLKNDQPQNALDVLYHYHQNCLIDSSREETMERIRSITADMNTKNGA